MNRIDLEEMNLSPLCASEMQETDGGFWQFIVGAIVGGIVWDAVQGFGSGFNKGANQAADPTAW